MGQLVEIFRCAVVILGLGARSCAGIRRKLLGLRCRDIKLHNILTGDRDARQRAAKSLTILRPRATFVSSLERGVIRSLLWSTEKSSHRSVVTRREYV